MKQNKFKIIISGGGSGGHIFPAIAIANALKKNNNNIEILFVGAKNKMEMNKVPAAGYNIKGLWISGLQRRLSLKNLSFPFKVLLSMIKAKKIIKNFKPDAVIGTGGYASGPILKIATNKKIPTLIQEQNSFPGITNRLLAKHVNKICVAYNNMDNFFPKSKIVLTGNPIRQEFVNFEHKKEKALEYFNLSKHKKTLLVIGGSLGAKTINESIHKNLMAFIHNDIQILWQTGNSYFDIAKQYAQNIDDNMIKVYEFITKMDYAYASADIIVSRAGAIAVSELCALGKPAILIPSPNVAEDHQTKNAMALVNKNAAIIIKDNEAKKKLNKTIIDLLNNQKQQTELQNNISKMAFKNSADLIAEEIINMIGQHINEPTPKRQNYVIPNLFRNL
jgi:UDP-N-acetylglucosamine--N-acetylmuramyl-(pentapeptide) pyrophosphoryl-undecaprenol N-acetylglucosamine transferase